MADVRKRRTALPPAEEDLLVAPEVELVYKNNVSPSQMPTITSAADAYQVFKKEWNPNTIQLREEFKVLLLNGANKVLGIYHAFAGKGTSVAVDLRLIFAAAIKANAVSIILAHNHPSGALKASTNDVKLTERIKFVADLMDMSILDHLIINNENFHSMADNLDFWFSPQPVL